MISSISSQTIFPEISQAKHIWKASSFSLLNRINLNWEKTILFSNIGLLLAGIAVAFFMKLPLVICGLAAYGIFYLSMQGRLQDSRPTESTVSQLQDDLRAAREQNNVWSEKFKRNLSASQTVAEVEQDLKKKMAKIGELAAREKRHLANLDKIDAERKIVRDEHRKLAETLDKLERIATTSKDREKLRVIREMKKDLKL